MAEGGKIPKVILKKLSSAVKPGLTTESLDKLAQELVFSYAKKFPQAGIRSSFYHYHNFPAHLCVSINDEVVHGVPGKRELKEEDIVSLDYGAFYKDFHTDAAVTVGVGRISPLAKKLIAVTQESLWRGIKEAKAGKTLGDIGWAIQSYVEKNGFQVVKELTGHGIGRQLHEAPHVSNFGPKGQGEKLAEGMVIAIEPMVAVGTDQIILGDDGFVYKTADGSLAAHFEHTVAITKRGPVVLTK